MSWREVWVGGVMLRDVEAPFGHHGRACGYLAVGGGRLRHIGVGRTHAGTHVLLLVQDLEVRVINAATGELLRELTINPARDYQATGRPPGPAPKKQ